MRARALATSVMAFCWRPPCHTPISAASIAIAAIRRSQVPRVTKRLRGRATRARGRAAGGRGRPCASDWRVAGGGTSARGRARDTRATLGAARASRALADAVAAQLVEQRRPVDAEQFRRALAVAAARLERAQQEAPLG